VLLLEARLGGVWTCEEEATAEEAKLRPEEIRRRFSES
jgi:hypothetical protein